jgi:hypothetical protein
MEKSPQPLRNIVMVQIVHSHGTGKDVWEQSRLSSLFAFRWDGWAYQAHLHTWIHIRFVNRTAENLSGLQLLTCPGSAWCATARHPHKRIAASMRSALGAE